MYIHAPLTKIVGDKKRGCDGASLHVAPWTETSNDCIIYEEAMKLIGIEIGSDDYDYPKPMGSTLCGFSGPRAYVICSFNSGV
jgi:hypothetical protein